MKKISSVLISLALLLSTLFLPVNLNYGSKSVEAASVNLIAGMTGTAILANDFNLNKVGFKTNGQFTNQANLTNGDTANHIDFGGFADTQAPGVLYDLGGYYRITEVKLHVVDWTGMAITGVTVAASAQFLWTDYGSRGNYTADIIYQDSGTGALPVRGGVLSSPKLVRYVAFFLTGTENGWRAKEFEVYGENTSHTSIIQGKTGKNVKVTGGIAADGTFNDSAFTSYSDRPFPAATLTAYTDGVTSIPKDMSYHLAHSESPGVLYDLGGYYDIFDARGIVSNYTNFNLDGVDNGTKGMRIFASEDLDDILDPTSLIIDVDLNYSAVKGGDIGTSKLARYVVFFFGDTYDGTIRAYELQVFGTPVDIRDNLLTGITPQMVKINQGNFASWQTTTFGSPADLSGFSNGDIFAHLDIHGGLNSGDFPGLLYDLGGLYDIDKALAFPADFYLAYPVTGMRIYASDTLNINDGTSRVAFTNSSNLVYSASGLTAKEIGTTLETPRTVQYVAFFFTEGASGWRLRELELYGDAYTPPASYTITATSGINGSINPSSAEVAEGSSQTFTITPDPGYKIDSILVDGVRQVPVTNSYTFSNVASAHTIHVSFKLRPSAKVLAIGNSYTGTAFTYLPALLDAGGADYTLGKLHYGGASLEFHWGNIESDSAVYYYSKTGQSDINGYSIRQALESEDWDIVTIQQVSHLSGVELSFYPYVTNIYDYIRSFEPNAEVIIHQTWAYESTYAGIGGYGTQQGMFDALKLAYGNVSNDLGMRIIPSGESWQLARATSIGDTLTSDGTHGNAKGSYLAGAAWYEVLTGESILDNPYEPPLSDISSSDLTILEACVSEAVSSYNLEKSVSVMTDTVKTNYTINEELDLTGSMILVTYVDDSTEEVPINPSIVSGYDKTVNGVQNLTVYYKGFVASYDVVVGSIPSAPSGISLTKQDENFIVSISGWNPEHRYQIWTYQEVESGIFANETEKQNQWILSKPYTLGSNRSTDPDENFAWRPRGFTVSDGVLQADIGPIVSVDSNYTMAVKVLDGSGNFIGQYKDTFTPAGVGEVVISKVTVDGQYADEKSFVKDIAGGAPVLFSVTGNGVQGTEYTAIIDQTGDVLPAGGDSLNEFSWDLSTMKPGSYSVTLTAAAGTSSDSRKVHFRLYKVDYDTPYGEMTGLTANGAVDGNSYKIELTPSVTAGGVFKYRLSEPWGPAIHYSDPYTIPLTGPIIDLTSIGSENYGVYQLATYVFRNGVSSADDGIIRTITNERPGGFTLGVQVNGQPAGTETIDGLKEQDMVISAAAGSAIPDPQYEYSFWRRDANGWVMIRGYAESGTVTWRPNRIGAYTIQVRARNAGGKTYEALKNIEFEITDKNESKANISSITINQAELVSAAARTPVMIKANAVAADGAEDQLYKFIISNGYIYYVETVYSADPTYIWVPGKSGNYTINVLVKSQASFGKYDVIESFVVSVD